MTITIPKNVFLDNLQSASLFTSSKFGSSTTLQGVLLEIFDNKLHFYSTDMSSFFHSSIPVKINDPISVVLDVKKIIEFCSLLPGDSVELVFEKNKVRINGEKTTGSFPFIDAKEFPKPPALKNEQKKINSSLFLSLLPLVIFSASKDESRPSLNGVNFLDIEGRLTIVSTDGFRLSLATTTEDTGIPPMLVPSGFLSDIIKKCKGRGDVFLNYSREEKIVMFRVGDEEYYSRLIEGEFPPFEKVLPTEKKTQVTLDKDEFLSRIKIISVFARDTSNIVLCEFTKQGLTIKPKSTEGETNSTLLDCVFEGEEQKVAFNYRFILDFLNNIEGKKVKVEIVRPDAPVVFRVGDKKDFLHIIMPVRVQE